jgi:hypothetical protein
LDIGSLDQYLVIDGGKLTLTASTIPGAGIGELLTAYNGGQPLQIDNAQKSPPQENVITVTGTASFMRRPDLPVTGTFTLDAAGHPIMRLRFTLIGPTPGPNPWRFSQSFPDLPSFPQDKTETDTPAPPLLDTLPLINSAFVLANQDGKDSVTSAALTTGLNFVSQVQPKGLVGLFSTLLGDTSYTLYGPIHLPTATQITPLPLLQYPWQVTWPVPGIHLQADLGGNHTIPGSAMTFHDLKLRLYCPPDRQWLRQNPALAFRPS